jgi:hypothetical protein
MVVQIEGSTGYTQALPAYADQGRTSGFDVVKAKRKIKATLPVIDRILRLLDVIAKVANLSQPEKRQAIDASKGRDLREAEKRFVNTQAFTAPGMYDEGTTKAVRGPTGERTGTEMEQGIRPLPQDVGSDADVARTARYRNIPNFGDFAPEGSQSDTQQSSQQSSVSSRGTERPGFYWLEPPERTPQGSVSSSMEARQAMRPGFYESGSGRGGCHSCEEMEGGREEYQLKWTTDPKDWKQTGESQQGYPHGRLVPEEVRRILKQFDNDRENPAILLCDLDWRAMVKRAIKYPIEEWKLREIRRKNSMEKRSSKFSKERGSASRSPT